MGKKVCRTFWLGAGFTKAVAGGPLTNELWSKIVDAYNKQKNRDDISEEHQQLNKRIKYFNEIKDFIITIDKEAVSKYPSINNREYAICKKSKIIENLENLLTLIDLFIDAKLISVNRNGIETNQLRYIPFPINLPKNLGYNQLQSIRDSFITYLYLVFHELELDKIAYDFAKIINSNDNIITFNYDVVLEQSLVHFNKWHPYKGYQGVENFINSYDFDYFKRTNPEKPIKIHKMHGSINWTTSLFDSGNPKRINIILDNLENHKPFIKNTLNHREIANAEVIPTRKHKPEIIVPSFVKPFQQIEFFNIWKSAVDKIASSNELIIIGYSFRSEDSNAILLLSNLKNDSKIIIVDPYYNNIVNKILRVQQSRGHMFYR